MLINERKVDTMKCQNCNAEVFNGQQFCPSCGAKVVAEKQPPTQLEQYSEQSNPNSGFVPQNDGGYIPQGNSFVEHGFVPEQGQPIVDNQQQVGGFSPNYQGANNQYNNAPVGENNGFQNPNSNTGQYPNMNNSYNQGYQGVNQNFTTEQQDAKNNKAMGILSYLGLLCLVPLFAAKDSPFAQYHAKQGLTLAILCTGYPILKAIISKILYQISWSLGLSLSLPLNLIGAAVSIFSLVVAIIGIVNVCNGEKKELPLIGKIKLLK